VRRTPIGYVPNVADLDLTGLNVDHAKIAATLDVSPVEWLTETRLIDQWYATIGGNMLPDALRAELAALKQRVFG
jgi:phosphoenolpyruvate carboxykinase (GTP)